MNSPSRVESALKRKINMLNSRASCMSELLHMQRAMQTYLLDPGAAKSKDAIDVLVLETVEVSRDTRLHIYANAYGARFIEALSTDFNALHGYLGDEAFAELVHAYIAQYPSRHFSLRRAGEKLACFLETTAPYAEHCELRELVEFEWALCHAFDAADIDYASSADFFIIAPERWPELALRFIPALRALELRTNAPALWKSLNSEQPPPAVEIFSESEHWIVWRKDLKLLFRRLDRIEKMAFDLFRAGATFADVCEKLAENFTENEVPQRAAALLQQWLHDGLIVAHD
jgi:hypothetical protein